MPLSSGWETNRNIAELTAMVESLRADRQTAQASAGAGPAGESLYRAEQADKALVLNIRQLEKRIEALQSEQDHEQKMDEARVAQAYFRTTGQTPEQYQASLRPSVTSGFSSGVSVSGVAAPSGQPQNLADVIRRPQTVIDALQVVDNLRVAKVEIVQPVTTRLGSPVVIADEGMTIPVPIKLSAAIANCNTDTANISSTLNSLLSALRATGQLPS
jgi:hypothetical protein